MRRRGRAQPLARRLRDVSLDDRYLLDEGRVFLTGVQALVRVPLDQHRADRRRGLHTGTMISGYQGSPLGGFDQELQRHHAICEDHHVFHVPGVNEELGATAAWGSQLSFSLPGARYDGVLGMWYGKAPGLDRAADALRHGNMVGVTRTGGAIAIVGDDPSAKSSTLPTASETLLASMHMPVFFPGNPQEVLDLGLHAFACSRASGLWSGLKIVTNVADGSATAEVAPDRITPLMPDNGYEHVPNAHVLAPACLDMESSMLGPRTELLLAYTRANGINSIEAPAPAAWLGIVAAGKSYHDLRQALTDLGIGEAEMARSGVRLLKLGLIWPLEPQIVRDFAHGLDEILVVEEKRPFVETQLKEILYGSPDAPRVVGKRDERDAPLLSMESELDADAIARVVAARLRQRVTIDSAEARLAQLDARDRGPITLPMSGPGRTPAFCSGCPHNSSTPAPEGTLVGGGIGCHTMIVLNPEGRGQITGMTQMGGEGAQFIGMAPFTDDRHFVQNLGDGTFSHSGSLALRAAVAAGLNMTYKLLYNDTVAMTGGQDVEGGLRVPELTRLLELEGVRRIVVTTEEPKRYRGTQLASIAEVRPREQIMAVQRELAKVEGVTVLIHDQGCAAELRRKRKRGQAPDPPQQVHINERVCEGCGDCGEKSSCLSVLPVDTEFGRKTRIHQSSCNKDFSCLEGDCPSFLTVVPGKRARRETPEPPSLPDPTPLAGRDDVTIRMMGIGGTGVVTVSQILGMAALVDGAHVAGLDQTGLSQKGGPVTSDLRIARRPIEGSNKASAHGADVYLGFDVLGAAAPKNLEVASPERTLAVISTSAVPTSHMVVDTELKFPELAPQIDAIEGRTLADSNVYFDAQELSERLFGDHMPANMLAVGAAWQRGVLPLSFEGIERAIRLNGAAVEKNLAAFAWGRACVAAPDAVAAATREPEPEPAALTERELALLEGFDGELRRLLEIRVPELTAWGSFKDAEEYVAFVREVAAGGDAEMAAAVARNLYKLMAYKDEYEVARLHLAQEFARGDKVWFHLHPPLLRALGLKRKLKLGRWFRPAFRLLRLMRPLRGTPFDVFGYAKVRRVERKLPGEYRELVRGALDGDRGVALELAELPDVIRGYEQIKLRNVERFRKRAAELV